MRNFYSGGDHREGRRLGEVKGEDIFINGNKRGVRLLSHMSDDALPMHFSNHLQAANICRSNHFPYCNKELLCINQAGEWEEGFEALSFDLALISSTQAP